MRQLKIATQITNRDSQAVEKYLQEISKISMITPEEETVLAQRIKMGDQRALDKLPKQGSKAPWKLHQNYLLDLLALKFGAVTDDAMRFR